MSYIVRVERLAKWFGNNQAVKDVSFTIDRGDIYGFIGKNGAGKTTVMRILCGLMRPSKGRVEVTLAKPGISPNGPGLPRIGYLPQNIRFDNNQSAADILKFFGRLTNDCEDQAVQFALDMGLDLTKKAQHLSPGQQRKLQLAVATIGHPELLIFDEPTAGLDSVGVQQVREIIRELNKNGSTIFISSHVLMELDNLCSKVAVIDQGQLLYQGECASVYELEVAEATLELCKPLASRFMERCTVSDGKIYARIDRMDVPDLLHHLYERGVLVYGVKLIGLEMFYNDLMKAGA